MGHEARDCSENQLTIHNSTHYENEQEPRTPRELDKNAPDGGKQMLVATLRGLDLPADGVAEVAVHKHHRNHHHDVAHDAFLLQLGHQFIGDFRSHGTRLEREQAIAASNHKVQTCVATHGADPWSQYNKGDLMAGEKTVRKNQNEKTDP
jgi:hypothetical protein